MAHQLNISLPDDQFQQIVRLATQRGLAPEDLVASWLAERQRQEDALREIYPGIVSDIHIHNGEPVITGTRIQAAIVAEFAQHGASIEEIQEDFHLTSEQIQAAIDFMRQQKASQHVQP